MTNMINMAVISLKDIIKLSRKNNYNNESYCSWTL